MESSFISKEIKNKNSYRNCSGPMKGNFRTRHILLFTLLLVFSIPNIVFSQVKSLGSISGVLILDSIWEPTIYLSFIPDFEKQYTVSEDMIVSSSQIEEDGTFYMSLENLPAGFSFIRLHVVQKGSSSASLTLGGAMENFIHLIVNNTSHVSINNSGVLPVFSNMNIDGVPHYTTFKKIESLSGYAASISSENSLIDKEFIEEVVVEKLKQIADTCSVPIISLCALYNFDYQHDYEQDPQFYNAYLASYKKNKSEYFNAFRKELAVKNMKQIYVVAILLLVAIMVVSILLLIRKNKALKIRKLTVQERKVYELIKQGASNQEIAEAYNVEMSTVKTHVSNIFSKLKVKSRKDILHSPN
jgi:DNA-binding CsgD family transcriptional regulator